MSNPTTPFSWQMPTNTDLVTDLPADFEVFGQAVATSMQDLLGGTTGQVLKKNSNTDMDFVWSADAAGMTNPMTTTGDVIYSSPGSTPVRLGIGTANQVLRVNSGATAPEWATPASSNPASATSYVSSNQSTTSSTFVNLSTTQSVTVTTGTKALIAITLQTCNDTNLNMTYTSFEVTGASSVSAGSGNITIYYQQQGGSNTLNTRSGVFYLTGLTAGSNTFTLKFASGFPYNTASFSDRVISVIDMGS